MSDDSPVTAEIEGDVLRVTVWAENIRVIELYREGEFIGGFERGDR